MTALPALWNPCPMAVLVCSFCIFRLSKQNERCIRINADHISHF